MIAKISNGNNFSGIAEYVYQSKGEHARIIATEGVCDFNIEAMVAGFKLQAQMRPKCKEPVGHFALSFSPKDAERCTDEFMRDVALEYMQRMGFTDTQYAMFRHTDRNHPHLHVVYNRVNNKRQEISNRNDRKRSKRICRQITQKYGLHFGNGKEYVNRDRLKGADKVKYAIYDALKEALTFSKNWAQLRSALADEQIAVSFRTGQDGTPYGVIFTMDDISFGGSTIDKSMSYAKTSKALAVNLAETERMPRSAASHETSPAEAGQHSVPAVKTSGYTQVQEDEIMQNITDAANNAESSGDNGTAVIHTIADAVLAAASAEVHVSPAGGGGNNNDDRKKKRHEEHPAVAPRRRGRH